MDRRNADLMLLDAVMDNGNVLFHGIDWGRTERTGGVCPECQQPHSWRVRLPKRCRHCGIKFHYTAAESPRRVSSQNHTEGGR